MWNLLSFCCTGSDTGISHYTHNVCTSLQQQEKNAKLAMQREMDTAEKRHKRAQQHAHKQALLSKQNQDKVCMLISCDNDNWVHNIKRLIICV
jgi:hypothetical protein